MATKKIRQMKTEYHCRRCNHRHAVIVSIGREPIRGYRPDKRGYDITHYQPTPYKILYCPHCGTVDKRGYKSNTYILKAYRTHRYTWRDTYNVPSRKRIKSAVEQHTNIGEAEAFEEQKAEKEKSTIPASVQQSPTSKYGVVLRIQRSGRKQPTRSAGGTATMRGVQK
jgi:hypothetical protein